MSALKSRFFAVALCVAIVLTVVPAVLSAMGLRDLVREGVQTIATPFQWCLSRVYDGVTGFSDHFTEYDRLEKENESLREALREYEEALHENEALRAENHWLRGYLSLKNEHIDYKFLDAAVVGREAGSYATVITLNRGTAHGVEVGMPVITENGVFGYVKEVSYTSSKVLSIVETAVSVGAFVERSGVTGLVTGDYALRADGLVVMRGIPQDADIAVGDLVHTSGTGSVYPRGLLVGSVETITPDPYSRTVSAVLRPAEDLLAVDRLSHLMIVTDYEIYTEEETGEGDESGTEETPKG